jgi:hypothetical protein
MRIYRWLLILLCLGCKHQSQTAVLHIGLVDSGRSLKIKGFGVAIAAEINRDTSTGVWETLLPVYRMPADTDMKNYQPVQPGSYLLKDSIIVFTPDTPFVKGQTYFMRCYQFGGGSSAWDYVKGKKRPGSMHYVDLGF